MSYLCGLFQYSQSGDGVLPRPAAEHTGIFTSEQIITENEALQKPEFPQSGVIPLHPAFIGDEEDACAVSSAGIPARTVVRFGRKNAGNTCYHSCTEGAAMK